MMMEGGEEQSELSPCPTKFSFLGGISSKQIASC